MEKFDLNSFSLECSHKFQFTKEYKYCSLCNKKVEYDRGNDTHIHVYRTGHKIKICAVCGQVKCHYLEDEVKQPTILETIQKENPQPVQGEVVRNMPEIRVKTNKIHVTKFFFHEEKMTIKENDRCAIVRKT